MAFWADASLADPKRAYRWLLMNGPIPAWICKNVDKPQWKISSKGHKYINFTFNYPGNLEWQPIKLTLVDPVSPDAVNTMMKILESSGYKVPKDGDTSNNITTISKSSAIRALGNIKIRQIDAAGNMVEEWELVNGWVSSANFGKLDYDSEDLTQIELELTYDFAILRTANIGEPVDGVGPGLRIPTDDF